MEFGALAFGVNGCGGCRLQGWGGDSLLWALLWLFGGSRWCFGHYVIRPLCDFDVGTLGLYIV